MLNKVGHEQNKSDIFIPIILIYKVNLEQKTKKIFYMSLIKLIEKLWDGLMEEEMGPFNSDKVIALLM